MIQFGTGGWRAVIGDGFTRENIQKVATALGRRIRREGVEREICIGYDRRFLSREAAIWFTEAIMGEGVKVDFINLSAPTPQIMFTAKTRNLPYAAAITASHNPALYNGIKLFTRGGRDAVQEITDAIQAEANALADDPAAQCRGDPLDVRPRKLIPDDGAPAAGTELNHMLTPPPGGSP